MIVLRGGPHDHSHFKWDEPTPPKEIRLRGPDAHTTAVYTLSDRRKGHWVYGKCHIEWSTPPRLVNFVRYEG